MTTAYRTLSDIHPCLTYEDAPAAIEWLCTAFGFTRQFAALGADGSIMHAELSLGTGVVMVSSPKQDDGRVGPRQSPGSPAMLSVYVPDPDAHHDQAVAAGARVIRPLRVEEYGARGYMVEDPEGHQWYFGDYRPGAYWEHAPTALT
ncbi:MAG: VOC family protein [Casimicrobiaceae bacterium]